MPPARTDVIKSAFNIGQLIANLLILPVDGRVQELPGILTELINQNLKEITTCVAELTVITREFSLPAITQPPQNMIMNLCYLFLRIISLRIKEDLWQQIYSSSAKMNNPHIFVGLYLIRLVNKLDKTLRFNCEPTARYKIITPLTIIPYPVQKSLQPLHSSGSGDLILIFKKIYHSLLPVILNGQLLSSIKSPALISILLTSFSSFI